MGYWRRAANDFFQALAFHEASGNRTGQSNIHHYLCRLYGDLEMWTQALAHGCKALNLREESEVGIHPDADERLALVHIDLALLLIRKGNAQRAESYLKSSGSFWHNAGAQIKPDQLPELSKVWMARGELYSYVGVWPEARAAYEEAVNLLTAAMAPPTLQMEAVLLGLANASLKTGDWRTTITLLERIKALADESTRPDLHVRVLWLQADLEPPTARDALEKALALCNKSDADNDRLDKLGRETKARLDALLD